MKRRQHYVFQAYLREWLDQDGKLWCLRDAKIFHTDTNNVAHERDFYRVGQLNDDEIKFLKLFLSKEPTYIQQKLMSHLRIYQSCYVWQNELEIIKDMKTAGTISKETKKKISDLINYLVESSKVADDECDEEGISEKKFWDNEINNFNCLLCLAKLVRESNNNDVKDSFEKILKQLTEKTEEAVNDLEEDFLGFIETETLKWMKDFRDQNIKNIEDKDKRELFLDIAIHHFRTKAAKDDFEKNLTLMLSDEASQKCFEKYLISPENIRVENLKHLIFWYCQAALSNSLYTKKALITLLINDTDEPFLTSDRPIINLKADYKNLSQGVEDLIFYYPLSPRIALTINPNISCETIKTVELTQQDAEEYNNKIVQAAHELIFANKKDMLIKNNRKS